MKKPDKNKELAIGIDLGGTFTKAILADSNGRILAARKISTRVSDGPDTIISDMANLIRELEETGKKEKYRVIGAGIGLPGTVDMKLEKVVTAPNLKWEDVSVKREIEKATGLPCFLDNDANMAALGELYYGGGKGFKDFIVMTLGTGVGGGIVIDGKLYRGSSNNAAEIGHMTVDLNGERCPCGNYGCLERYASASAIERRMKIMLERKPHVAERTGEYSRPEELTARDIFELASKGDIIARNVILSAAEFLGIAIVNLVNVLNPQKIILGGGMARAGDVLIEPIMKIVRERIHKTVAERLIIEKSGLDNKAGSLGAAALAFERVCRFDTGGKKRNA